jgi:predicted transcriptional regulator
MADVTISARVPAELKTDLTALAQALQRSPSWVVEQAVRDYIEREREFLDAVEEGIRADDAGDLVEHADVVAELDRIIAARRP